VATASLSSCRIEDLQLARILVIKDHKKGYRVFGAMQVAYYKSDERHVRRMPDQIHAINGLACLTCIIPAVQA
jgi:hypothetical protein